MSDLRRAAHQIDPVLCTRKLGRHSDGVAGNIPASATRRLRPSVDRPPGRQDHDRGLGDCARDGVYARLFVSDCLSGVEPQDLSGNLIVQLGLATEGLNRRWYEASTGEVITDVQRMVRHPTLRWMCATLDGRVQSTEAVFEAKFMLPWYFSEEAVAEKYMPQLQHNMWIVTARTAVLSVITGGGKWAEIKIHADPLYQHLIVTAERKFWRCVENGEPPRLFGVDPPTPRIEAVRIVDMTSSKPWAEFAAIFARTSLLISSTRRPRRI
jgi:hypothetical protein